MSTTRLSRERLGRAVTLLRREHFSEEEIGMLLKRPKEQVDAARTSYWHGLRDYPTRWTCDKVDTAVINWAIANGIWPSARDFHRLNGLPSFGTFKYHDEPDHWCGGEWRQHRKEIDKARRAHYKRHSYYYRPHFYERSVAVDRRPHPMFWVRIAARAPELPAKLVLAIPNQTHRREALVNYGGAAKLVENGAGVLIQQDDFGTLWRVNWAEETTSDWFSVFVEVVNSTPRMRDDGTGNYVPHPDKNGKPVFEHYFLRVPPQMATAKQAVAWTGYFEPRTGVRGGMPANLDFRLGGREFAGFAAQS